MKKTTSTAFIVSGIIAAIAAIVMIVISMISPKTPYVLAAGLALVVIGQVISIKALIDSRKNK